MRLAEFAEPLVKLLPPEIAHRVAVTGMKIAPPGPARPREPCLAVSGSWVDVSEPSWARRGIRQERRGSGRDAEARIWLCRGRNADASSSGRQRAPATLPAARGRRGHQPVRLQQRGLRQSPDAPRAAAGGPDRRQRRGQQGLGRSHRGLRPRRQDLRPPRRLHRDQRFVAEHAGPARSAAARGARRTRRPRRRGPRRDRAAPTGARQDRPGSRRTRTRRHCRGRPSRRIDGLIVSNTTVARRPRCAPPRRSESGGLSGRPLFEPSTGCWRAPISRLAARCRSSAAAASRTLRQRIAKIEAGASLVQIYTSLALKGVGVVDEILNGLERAVGERGVASIAALTGVRAADWAAHA